MNFKKISIASLMLLLSYAPASADRMVATGYAGEVVRTFASPLPGSSDTKTGVDAGLRVSYDLYEFKSLELKSAVEVGHTAAQALTGSALEQADAIEAHASLSARKEINNGETGLEVKATAGFVRLATPTTDALDDHSLTLGVVHLVGPLAGSGLEAGYARSQAFGDDQNRLKVTARLEYRGEDRPLGFYLQGDLRADLGSGPDDFVIKLGTYLPLSEWLGGLE